MEDVQVEEKSSTEKLKQIRPCQRPLYFEIEPPQLLATFRLNIDKRRELLACPICHSCAIDGTDGQQEHYDFHHNIIEKIPITQTFTPVFILDHTIQIIFNQQFIQGRGRHFFCTKCFSNPLCNTCYQDYIYSRQQGRASRSQSLLQDQTLVPCPMCRSLSKFYTNEVPCTKEIFCFLSFFYLQELDILIFALVFNHNVDPSRPLSYKFKNCFLCNSNLYLGSTKFYFSHLDSQIICDNCAFQRNTRSVFEFSRFTFLNNLSEIFNLYYTEQENTFIINRKIFFQSNQIFHTSDMIKNFCKNFFRVDLKEKTNFKIICMPFRLVKLRSLDRAKFYIFNMYCFVLNDSSKILIIRFDQSLCPINTLLFKSEVVKFYHNVKNYFISLSNFSWFVETSLESGLDPTTLFVNVCPGTKFIRLYKSGRDGEAKVSELLHVLKSVSFDNSIPTHPEIDFNETYNYLHQSKLFFTFQSFVPCQCGLCESYQLSSPDHCNTSPNCLLSNNLPAKFYYT